MDAMTAKKSPAPPPHKRRLRRLAKFLAIGVFVLGAIVLLTPVVLSMDWARKALERRAGEVLGVQVRIDGYSFNWLSGFRIHGVRIENPTGFRQDRPLLAFDEARGDISLLSLLTHHGIDASASLDGLKIHLEELTDGRSNLGVLFGTVRGRKEEELEEGGAPSSRRARLEGLDLSALRLQVRLADASIEIVRSGTVIESLRVATARISKEFGDSDLRLETTVDLLDPGSGQPSGRLEAALDLDASLQRPLTARFTSQNLELGRYSSLIASLADPGAVTAIEGTVNGTVLARVSSPENFEFSGTLTVDGLRLAGGWFAGMDIVSDHWILGPNLVVSLADGRPAVVETEAFFVDTGFCTLRGVAGGSPGNLALEYAVDLQALASFGGPIPAEFAGSGARVRGRIEVPLKAGMAGALETLIAAVRHDGAVQLDRLVWKGVEFESVDAKMDLSRGVLRLTTGPSARINGGPLSLSAEATLGDLSSLPFQASFKLQESELQGDLLQVLAYAIPLLGGLGDTTGARFEGKLSLTGTLRGPALPEDGEHWLEWLNHWTGSGDLELRSASLALAPSLASFLEATGNRGNLAVDSYRAHYSIRDGAVATNLAKLSTKGKQIGFSGTTTLDGRIDYWLDVSGLLASHRDGEKVLRALGGKMPPGRLAGTLASPTIALPDIAELFQTAGVDILQERALEELNRTLNKLFGIKK